MPRGLAREEWVSAWIQEVEAMRVEDRSLETNFFVIPFKHESVSSSRQEVVTHLDAAGAENGARYTVRAMHH